LLEEYLASKDKEFLIANTNYVLEQLRNNKTLEESEQVYRVMQVPESEGGRIEYDVATDEVLVLYVVSEKKFENLIHELRHALQFENGEISLQGKAAGLLYDINDELDAYDTSKQADFKGLANPMTVEGLLSDKKAEVYKNLPTDNRNLENYKPQLMQLNKSGMVDYYINWRNDL